MDGRVAAMVEKIGVGVARFGAGIVDRKNEERVYVLDCSILAQLI